MKYFVKDASYLSRIKKTKLRKMLMNGSCHITPLEKKVTVMPWDSDGGFIYTVHMFAPNRNTPCRVFELNDQTRISVTDWYSIFESVHNYEEFYAKVLHKEKIKTAITDFENAIIQHALATTGIMLQYEHDKITAEEMNAAFKKTGRIKTQARRALSELVL